MHPMRQLFLRFYAANLERKSRNDAPTACQDAMAQIVFVLVVPLSALLFLAFSLVIRTNIASRRDNAVWVIIAAAIVVTLVSRPFKSYAASPIAAAMYRSKRARVLTGLYFFGVPIFGILMFLIDFSIIDRFNSRAH
jgi:hypothetical protein